MGAHDSEFLCRAARSAKPPLAVRGLRCTVSLWGDPATITRERPLLVWMHGWMDVGASLQFVVDAMREERVIAAPDWRLPATGVPPGTDAPPGSPTMR